MPKPLAVPRPVAQYDLDGNLVAKHPSLTAAARAMKGSSSNVVNAVDNTRTAYGFIWRSYVTEPPKTIPVQKKRPPQKARAASTNSRSIPVSAYDSLGNYVRTYASKSQAARENDSHVPGVIRTIKNPTHRVNGFYLRETVGDPPKRIEIPISDYYLKLERQTEERAARKLAEREQTALRYKVIEIDAGGNTVREFKNMADAARHYRVSRELIRQAVLLKIKRAVGRRFRMAHPELQKKG